MTVLPLPSAEVPARIGTLDVVGHSSCARLIGISAGSPPPASTAIGSCSSATAACCSRWHGRDGHRRRLGRHDSQSPLSNPTGPRARCRGAGRRSRPPDLVADEWAITSTPIPGGSGPVRSSAAAAPFAARRRRNQGLESLTPCRWRCAGDRGAFSRRARRASSRDPVAMPEWAGRRYVGDKRLDPADAATAGDWLLALERGVSLLTGWRVGSWPCRSASSAADTCWCHGDGNSPRSRDGSARTTKR